MQNVEESEEGVEGVEESVDEATRTFFSRLAPRSGALRARFAALEEPSAAALLERLLCVEPRLRASCHEALRHPFFSVGPGGRAAHAEAEAEVEAKASEQAEAKTTVAAENAAHTAAAESASRAPASFLLSAADRRSFDDLCDAAERCEDLRKLVRMIAAEADACAACSPYHHHHAPACAPAMELQIHSVADAVS